MLPDVDGACWRDKANLSTPPNSAARASAPLAAAAAVGCGWPGPTALDRSVWTVAVVGGAVGPGPPCSAVVAGLSVALPGPPVGAAVVSGAARVAGFIAAVCAGTLSVGAAGGDAAGAVASAARPFDFVGVAVLASPVLVVPRISASQSSSGLSDASSSESWI